MTSVELKEKIVKTLDNIPEGSLPEVLEFINKIQQRQYIDDATITRHIYAIISENRGLFERLAKQSFTNN